MTNFSPESTPSLTRWRRFSFLMLVAGLLTLSVAVLVFRGAYDMRGRPTNASFRFISWGDTHFPTGLSTLSVLSVSAAGLHPAFTLYTGDLEESGFTQAGMDAWKVAMNGGVNNGMSERTLPVRGNHDLKTGDTAGWQAYFKAGSIVARVGGTNYRALTDSLSYSFDYGNSHFIGVDVPGGAPLITAAEIAWVDRDLAVAEGRGLMHAFIYFHGPIYSANNSPCTSRPCPTDANVASFIRVLNKHPIVSATFHGHIHTSAYVHIDNTHIPEVTHPFEEFVTGGAGARSVGCPSTYGFDYCMGSRGFVAVDVSGPDFTVNFYPQGRNTPAKVYTFHKSGS
jgi:hypothetical protein